MLGSRQTIKNAKMTGIFFHAFETFWTNDTLEKILEKMEH